MSEPVYVEPVFVPIPDPPPGTWRTLVEGEVHEADPGEPELPAPPARVLPVAAVLHPCFEPVPEPDGTVPRR